jgi:hypothetical protein
VRRQLDDVAGLGVLDGILEQRVERVRSASGSARIRPGEIDVEPPGTRGDLRPADEEVG